MLKRIGGLIRCGRVWSPELLTSGQELAELEQDHGVTVAITAAVGAHAG